MRLMLLEEKARSIATPAFRPDDISGLICWLEADLITGLADADPVVTWLDETSNDNDATNAVGAQRPTFRTGVLNGLAVVRFDGVDDELSTAAFSSALSFPNFIYTISLNSNAEGDSAFIMDGIAGGNRNTIFSDSSGTPDDIDIFAGETASSGVAWVKDEFHIISALFNDTNSDAYLDGAQIIDGDDAGGVDMTGLKVGSNSAESSPFDGDIYLILVYDNDIGDIARGQLDTHFAAKTGIALT